MYYGRLGFEPAVKYGIEIHLPDWAPPEAAQVIRLTAFDPDDPTLRGTVVYPPAFDGLEWSTIRRRHAPRIASVAQAPQSRP